MSHPETWAKKKQDPLAGTYVSPRDMGKKTKPMWGRRDSMSPLLRDKQYPVPSHWVGEEGLIDAPPPIKGDKGAHPCPPR